MKILKRIAAWGAVMTIVAALAAAAALNARPVDAQQDMDRFFKAKELVFERDWGRARAGLESYLKDFPDGRLRDEALYWLAECLDQSSRAEKNPAAIIGLKRAAADRLGTLIGTYPGSLWKDDAGMRRVEIAATLVLLGEESYTSIIEEAVQKKAKDARSIKLSALRALADLDPKTSLPILRRVLATEPEAEVRLHAVRLLVSFPEEDIQPALEEAARNDKDEKVRNEAAALVKILEQRRAPVSLRYFIYGSRLLDERLFAAFPEKDVREFSLERSAEGSSRALLAKARQAIGGEISTPSSAANGTLPFPLEHGLNSRTTHRAGDYQVWINNRTLTLSPGEISGEIEFRRRGTNEVFTRPFRVNPSHDKLLIARSGANISLLLFQFVGKRAPEKENDFIEDLITKFGLSDKGTFFSDLFGWQIQSSRSSWDLDEFGGRLGVYDFGTSEATSKLHPGWVLRGNLLLMTKERIFLARQGVLIEPSGKRAAEAPVIYVPLDDPSGFSPEESAKPGGMRGAAYGPLEVASRITLTHGIKVHTEKVEYGLGDFDGNMVDLAQAKVEVPAGPGKNAGPVRIPSGGGVWTLLGDIFYFKKQDKLVGFGSLLLNSDREVVGEGLIEVPAADPTGFKVLRGQTYDKNRRVVPSDEERRTRPIFPTMLSGHLGWAVLTTRHSAGSSAGGDKEDFGLARADRSYGGRDWVLIGQLISLQKERVFLARQAALIASDGTIVHGAELRVPADNPEDCAVVRKSP